ncbi:hypothetical protein ACLOJK_014401 [Asimina triloba]
MVRILQKSQIYLISSINKRPEKKLVVEAIKNSCSPTSEGSANEERRNQTPTKLGKMPQVSRGQEGKAKKKKKNRLASSPTFGDTEAKSRAYRIYSCSTWTVTCTSPQPLGRGCKAALFLLRGIKRKLAAVIHVGLGRDTLKIPLRLVPISMRQQKVLS